MRYRMVAVLATVLMTWMMSVPALHAQDTAGQIIVTRAMLEGEGLETKLEQWTWVTPGRTYEYAVRWRDRSDKDAWHRRDHTLGESDLPLFIGIEEDGIVAGQEYVFRVTATDTESSEKKQLRFIITADESTAGQMVVTRAMLEGEGLETKPEQWTWVTPGRTYEYAMRWRDRSDKDSSHRRDHTLGESDLPLFLGTEEEGVIAGQEYVFRVTATDTESSEQKQLRFVITADEYTGMLLMGAPPAEVVALAEDMWSVEDFVQGLPQLHKEQALVMVASKASDAAFVDKKNPRVISWGATADVLLAWGTNPQSPRYDTVEFIVPQDDEWTFGVVDFSDEAFTKVSTSTSCASCHAGHPLWASYRDWPGTLGPGGGLTPQKREALVKRLAKSTDKRIAALKGWPGDRHPSSSQQRLSRYGHILPAQELTLQLILRHAEVLVNSLPQETFDRIAKRLICEEVRAVEQQFPVAQMDLHVMADGTFVDPGHKSRRREFFSGGMGIDDGVLLLLIKHFYDTNNAVKTLYQTTDNRLTSSPRSPRFLQFAPGAATAADELLSIIDVAFRLKGEDNAQARARGLLRREERSTFGVHVNYMAPKVCAALNADAG